MSDIQHCPLCGTPVIIRGKTTKYYVPIVDLETVPIVKLKKPKKRTKKNVRK